MLLFVFSKKGGEIRNNIDIRVTILESKLKHYKIAKEQISAIGLTFFESGIIQYINAHKSEYKEFLENEID